MTISTFRTFSYFRCRGSTVWCFLSKYKVGVRCQYRFNK